MRSRSRRCMFCTNSRASRMTDLAVLRLRALRFARIFFVILVCLQALAMLDALAAVGAAGEWHLEVTIPANPVDVVRLHRGSHFQFADVAVLLCDDVHQHRVVVLRPGDVGFQFLDAES